MTLAELEIGKDAIIESVDCPEIALRKHILDMGLTPGTEVTLIKVAPMGDPMEIRIRGYELTLRKDEAAYITLMGIHNAHEMRKSKERVSDVAHPHVGETGIYHVHAGETIIPDNEILSFGLAAVFLGNQEDAPAARVHRQPIAVCPEKHKGEM